MSTYFSSSSETITIRQVWNENLDSEFRSIREMIDGHVVVSVHIEFPGIVYSTNGSVIDFADHYVLLKTTVDKVKPAQVGLTISNGTNVTSWQFNLKGFDPSRDLHANEAIQNMTLRGIDFQKINLDQGIEVDKFDELLMSSGVVCNDEVTWVSFRSAFDFGYLVKMLSGKDLPDDVTYFKPLVKAYCGGTDVYDIKLLMKHCGGLTGGLDDVASILEVKLDGRICEQQAGVNSLLTFKVFEKIKDLCLDGPEKHAGIIYGLGTII